MSRVASIKQEAVNTIRIRGIISQAECVVIDYNRHKAPDEEPIVKVGACLALRWAIFCSQGGQQCVHFVGSKQSGDLCTDPEVK